MFGDALGGVCGDELGGVCGDELGGVVCCLVGVRWGLDPDVDRVRGEEDVGVRVEDDGLGSECEVGLAFLVYAV